MHESILWDMCGSLLRCLVSASQGKISPSFRYASLLSFFLNRLKVYIATRERYCLESYSPNTLGDHKVDCGYATGPLVILSSFFCQGGDCVDSAAVRFILCGCEYVDPES